MIFAAVFAQTLLPANLAVSTYLKDGFTPSAIATDAQGNVYLAGYASIDPVSQTSSAVVAKLDPKVSGYVVDLYVNDNTRVQKGDLLLRIDARDYVTAVDQARAQLALAQAQLNTARNALRIARVQYPAQLQAASAQQRA